MTFVQAEMMNAKTIASLLPFFVISGVVTAGMTTDDPYWYHNNFSQLGDRTTFAARMFNSTLILTGNTHHHRQLLRHLRTGDHLNGYSASGTTAPTDIRIAATKSHISCCASPFCPSC